MSCISGPGVIQAFEGEVLVETVSAIADVVEQVVQTEEQTLTVPITPASAVSGF